MAVASCHMLSGHADLAPRKAALGQPCSVESDCQTAECVDGVCCGNPCLGPCSACDLPEHVGVCTAIPAFRDPDGDCEAGVCDGSARCASGERGSVTWLGAGRDQQVLDIALGPLDEVAAVGRYAGAIDGIDDSGRDIDGDGLPNQWRLQLTVNGIREASSVIEAPDTADFVDDIAAAVLVDGTPLWGRTRVFEGGERDVWVTSPDGAFSLRLGEPGVVERLIAMDAAPDGDVVLLGTFGVELDLGAAGLLDGGEEAWFLVKVAPNGTPRWGRVLRATTSPFGKPGTLVLSDVEAEGRIAVAGSFVGAIDATGSLIVSEQSAGLVVAFGLDGTLSWVVTPTFADASGADTEEPAQSGPARATRVVVTPNGDVVATFADGAVPGSRWARYRGHDAKVLWTRPIGPPLTTGDTGSLEVTALAAGHDGDLHLGVRLNEGRFDVAGQRFEGWGTAVALRASANGGYLAATALGQGRIGAMAVDSHGDLVVGATLFGQVGPAPLEPLVANGLDAVITKLRSDGEALWRQICGDGGKPIATTSVASAGEHGSVVGGVVSGELAPETGTFLGVDSQCSVDGFVVRRPPDDEPWQRSFYGCFGGGRGIDDMSVAAARDGWVFALGSTGADTPSAVEYGPPGASPSQVTQVPLDPPDLGGFLVGIDPVRAPEDGHPFDWELRLPMVGAPRLMANGRGGVVAAFEKHRRELEDPFGPIDIRELTHEGKQRWRQDLGLSEACAHAHSRCLRDVYAGDGGVALLTWATTGGCAPSAVVSSCISVLRQEGSSGRVIWGRRIDGYRLDAVALRPDNRAFATGSVSGLVADPALVVSSDAEQIGVMIELRADGFPVSATDLGCAGITRGRVHGTDIEVSGDTVIVVGQASPGDAPLLPVPGGPSFPRVDTSFAVKLGFGVETMVGLGEGCPVSGESAWRALWLRELRGLAQQPPHVAIVPGSGRVLLAGSVQGDLTLDNEIIPTGGEAFLVEFEP